LVWKEQIVVALLGASRCFSDIGIGLSESLQFLLSRE
jgi:hypothetical protein